MQAAMRLAAPVRHGATDPGRVLSGAGAGCAIHRPRDDWAACAAFAPRFAERLARVAGTDVAGFPATLTMAGTAALAAARDLPTPDPPGAAP